MRVRANFYKITYSNGNSIVGRWELESVFMKTDFGALF
jgi:hypothetical protein